MINKYIFVEVSEKYNLIYLFYLLYISLIHIGKISFLLVLITLDQ